VIINGDHDGKSYSKTVVKENAGFRG